MSRLARLCLAALAVILGWLAPVHAIGPEHVEETNAVVHVEADDLRSIALVVLAAYRANGPPESIIADAVNASPEHHARGLVLVVLQGSTHSAWSIQYAYAGGDPVFSIRHDGI